jgi:hypothetical protein
MTREYLAAVDRVLSAVERAKMLREALRREIGKNKRKGRRETTSN